jgi:hypothetical protein
MTIERSRDAAGKFIAERLSTVRSLAMQRLLSDAGATTPDDRPTNPPLLPPPSPPVQPRQVSYLKHGEVHQVTLSPPSTPAPSVPTGPRADPPPADWLRATILHSLYY